MSPYELAKFFHETYERLAPEYGYETRKETAISWEDIPEDNPNKNLMIAVAYEVLNKLPGQDGYLKRIADAMEAGNEINKNWVELNKQWHAETSSVNQDWILWNKEQKQEEFAFIERKHALSLEKAEAIQRETNATLYPIYEAALRNGYGQESVPGRAVYPSLADDLLHGKGED